MSIKKRDYGIIKRNKSSDRVYPEYAKDHRSHENGIFSEAPSYPDANRTHTPLANKLSAILNGLLDAECDLESPYTEKREVKQVALAVFSSSSGLCGTFNANVWKELSARLHELEAQHTAVCLYPIGKKIADELHKAGYTTEDDFLHLGEKPSYEEAVRLAGKLMELFSSGKADRVELLYHHFKNMATQVLTHKVYLPVTLPQVSVENTVPTTDYILEPSPESLQALLFPKLLNLTFTRHYSTQRHPSMPPA